MKKSGAKVGLAVAAGYYLGRRRKLRLAGALALAGVAGLRRKSKLLDKGIKALGSPELEELAERLRTDLRDVGRTAVTVATNRPINALSDVIHDRAEALRHPEEHVKAATATATTAAGTAAKTAEDVTGTAAGEAAKATGPAQQATGRAGETVGGVAGNLTGLGAKPEEGPEKTGEPVGAEETKTGESDTPKAERQDEPEAAEREPRSEKQDESKGTEGDRKDETKAREDEQGERRTEPVEGSAEAGLRV